MTIFQKINLIPDLINEKKLTETQAVNYICTQLLKNPKLFIRENLEEDLISDLIEILLQKKDAIFSSYKKEISPFYSFLKNYIYYKFLLIKKKMFQSYITDESYKHDCKISLETQMNTNEFDEFCYKTATYTPYTISDSEKTPYIRQKHFQNFNDNQEFDIKKHIKTLLIKEKTALLCALKYIYYLSPENLREISNYCKIPVNFLISIKENLSRENQEKIEKIEKLKISRNKAYFMHRKYDIELSVLTEKSKENSLQYKKIEKKSIRQTELWKEKVAALKSRKRMIVLTNKEIANIININERTVSFYINKAKDVV